VRFLYGFPASLLLLLFIFHDYDIRTLHLPAEFYLWLVPAAIIQILFTIILGKAFEQRNFATSIALSKTDAIQAALFELVLLSLVPDIKVVIAISISFLGVYIISLSRNKGDAATNWRQKANSVALGLLAGLALGGCSVFFRIAMDTLPYLDVLHRAVLTAFLSVAIQTVIMGVALLIWRQDEFFACVRSWRVSSFAGTVAAITTFMWFVAFSLIGVAPVRMLGQVEIIFSMAFSFWFFKEQIGRTEIMGIAFIITSVWILLS
jgi:drug/metabolite transporter (DMT)-like permease